MKNKQVLFRALFSLCVATVLVFGWKIYRPNQLKEFQLSASTKVVRNKLGTEAIVKVEVQGQQAELLIKKLNQWLAMNQKGWSIPFDDSIPELEFQDGDTRVLLWRNLIIVYSATLGSFMKAVDPRENLSLSEIVSTVGI